MLLKWWILENSSFKMVGAAIRNARSQISFRVRGMTTANKLTEQRLCAGDIARDCLSIWNRSEISWYEWSLQLTTAWNGEAERNFWLIVCDINWTVHKMTLKQHIHTDISLYTHAKWRSSLYAPCILIRRWLNIPRDAENWSLEDVLPSQSLRSVLKKLNLAQDQTCSSNLKTL